MADNPLDEWLHELARSLGVEYVGDTRVLLDVARDAAHNVDRPAAPLTTFLVGYAAGRGDGSAEAALQAGRTASELALGWPGRTATD